MTAVRSLHAVSARRTDPAAEQPAPPRLIGVGIHDVVHDRATLEWAVADAAPAIDQVHVVHGYVPLRLDGCAWPPVSTVRDRRHGAATRVVAQAVQRAQEGHPRLEVGGSAIGGLPEDVLIELSHVVDLLVIGDDSYDPLIARKITTRVQEHAHCPLVCVPRDYLPAAEPRPVTVVADDRGLLEPVLAFATSLARRHGVGLQVSRAWSSLHEGRVTGPGWLAEQQEELDTQLAGWRAACPDLPVTARLELGYSWLDRLRAASSVLVTSARAVDLVRSPSDPVHACPVAIVPD
jgi:hypothetical protein